MTRDRAKSCGRGLPPVLRRLSSLVPPVSSVFLAAQRLWSAAIPSPLSYPAERAHGETRKWERGSRNGKRACSGALRRAAALECGDPFAALASRGAGGRGEVRIAECGVRNGGSTPAGPPRRAAALECVWQPRRGRGTPPSLPAERADGGKCGMRNGRNVHCAVLRRAAALECGDPFAALASRGAGGRGEVRIAECGVRNGGSTPAGPPRRAAALECVWQPRRGRGTPPSLPAERADGGNAECGTRSAEWEESRPAGPLRRAAMAPRRPATAPPPLSEYAQARRCRWNALGTPRDSFLAGDGTACVLTAAGGVLRPSPPRAAEPFCEADVPSGERRVCRVAPTLRLRQWAVLGSAKPWRTRIRGCPSSVCPSRVGRAAVQRPPAWGLLTQPPAQEGLQSGCACPPLGGGTAVAAGRAGGTRIRDLHGSAEPTRSFCQRRRVRSADPTSLACGDLGFAERGRPHRGPHRPHPPTCFREGTGHPSPAKRTLGQ